MIFVVFLWNLVSVCALRCKKCLTPCTKSSLLQRSRFLSCPNGVTQVRRARLMLVTSAASYHPVTGLTRFAVSLAMGKYRLQQPGFYTELTTKS